jgi:D-alanine transfer protein
MDKTFHWIKNEIISLLLAIALVVIGLFLLSLKEDVNQAKNIGTLQIKGETSPIRDFQVNYAAGNQAELNLMSSLQRKEQITLFGSSEFTDSPFAPYNFLPDSIGVAAMGFGHAFHQTFAIYCQLLAANELLPGSKVCILISPGWFQTEGTNTEAFLEFVPENFMKRIYLDSTLTIEKKMVGEYISKNEEHFNSLSSTMEKLSIVYPLQQGFSPLAQLKSFLSSKLSKNQSSFQSVNYSVNKSEKLSPKAYNFNRQLALLKVLAPQRSPNNSIYVDSAFYSKNLADKNGTHAPGHLEKVQLAYNAELKDFIRLLDFLKRRKVDASFIIQPLNPYYYTNTEILNPLISALKQKLDKAKFPYLNMYVSDKSKYVPGTLNDVMHLGDLGWMKINQFLIQTYAK